jgi:hypothetical protein
MLIWSSAAVSDRKQAWGCSSDAFTAGPVFSDAQYLETCAVPWMQQHELTVHGGTQAILDRLGSLRVAPYDWLL